MTTIDLSEFGHEELGLLKKLIDAMISQGLPIDFSYDEVIPMMNTHSGNVFLTNRDYEVAMMNGDILESYYTLSYDGHEGFISELMIDYRNGNINEENYEELAGIFDRNEMSEEADKIRKTIGVED